MSTIIDMLENWGIARLPAMAPAAIAELRGYLETRPVYNAHMRKKATAAPLLARQAFAEQRWPMFCHSMDDVTLAPHLFETALELTPLAGEFLEVPPWLFSFNAFWTQPAPGARPYGETHGYHRDGDDVDKDGRPLRFLALFIYGTDVLTPEDGAHVFLRGTHLTDGNKVPANHAEIAETVLGTAGTMFLAYTRGFHQGLRPRGRRLMIWARWSTSNPPVPYGWDHLYKYVVKPDRLPPGVYPADPELRRAVSLVVA